MRRCASMLLTGILLVELVGCGGAEGPPPPKLYGVSGTLTEGDKPMPNINVTLMPVDPAAFPATGVTGADGKFVVSTNGRLGAMPGKYKVVLMAAAKSGPTTIKDLEQISGAGVKTKGMPKLKTPFPESWTRPETTPLEHEVVDKSTTLDINL